MGKIALLVMGAQFLLLLWVIVSSFYSESSGKSFTSWLIDLIDQATYKYCEWLDFSSWIINWKGIGQVLVTVLPLIAFFVLLSIPTGPVGMMGAAFLTIVMLDNIRGCIRLSN